MRLSILPKSSTLLLTWPALLVLSLACNGPAAEPAAALRPNILIILADDDALRGR